VTLFGGVTIVVAGVAFFAVVEIEYRIRIGQKR
jgi:hypothetical protein